MISQWKIQSVTFVRKMDAVLLLFVPLLSSAQGAPTTAQQVLDLGFDLGNKTQWWPGSQKYEVIEQTRQRNQNGISWKMDAVFMLLGFLLRMTHGAPTSHRILDLGYDLSNNTQWWPVLQKFEIFERIRYTSGLIPWLAINTFKSAEHVSTHVDAPFHFAENGWKLGDIPLERFFSPGLLIDVSEEVQDNFDFELEPQHIQNWEKENGPIPENSVVLVRFGWSEKYYNNRDEYFGFNKTSHFVNFPGLSKAAATKFVNRRVYGVGVDTPSLDPGKDETFLAHNVLLGANIFGIEHLNLTSQQIPVKDFMLHVMPMKITEGTGAPARVMAFINSQENGGFHIS